MTELTVYWQGRKVGRAVPQVIGRHAHPKAPPDEDDPAPAPPPWPGNSGCPPWTTASRTGKPATAGRTGTDRGERRDDLLRPPGLPAPRRRRRDAPRHGGRRPDHPPRPLPARARLPAHHRRRGL